jgi:hypothetical protein
LRALRPGSTGTTVAHRTGRSHLTIIEYTIVVLVQTEFDK